MAATNPRIAFRRTPEIVLRMLFLPRLLPAG
jgi:hypothetical protein